MCNSTAISESIDSAPTIPNTIAIIIVGSMAYCSVVSISNFHFYH